MPKLPVAFLLTNYKFLGISFVHGCPANGALGGSKSESLTGHLYHAAKVVWPGRTFLHRMIDRLCCFQTKDHPVRLNQEFHRDLLWWHHFLDQWHGVSFWLFPGLSPATDLQVSSDAAGSLGFWAFFKG